jgi:hypothetical protein
MVVLVPLTWLSGLLVYSNYDGRFGSFGLSVPGNWVDIHGTSGVLLWPLALIFALYALSIGQARLNLAANTAALLGLTTGSWQRQADGGRLAKPRTV